MSAEERPRLPWVDAARGLGIVLVVLGHAIVGQMDAGLLERGGFWGQLYYLVYAFHMPLFFLLSGLFAARFTRRPTPRVLCDLGVRLVWPYWLWSSVQLLALGAAAHIANHPAELSWDRWLALAWRPLSPFWFLQTLLVWQLLAWVTLPRAGTWGLLLLALAAQQVPALLPMPISLTNGCRFGVFFALGVQASVWQGPWPALPSRGRLWLLSAIGLALTGWFSSTLLQQDRIPWHAAGQPAAFLGVAAVLAAVAALPAPWRDGLAQLGRSTMVIFLLHVMFLAGTRIALHHLIGWRQPELLLGLSCAAAIAGPWSLGRLAVRQGWQRALGFGG